MENFSYHVPVYVVNAGVATSGHSADLQGGQVGLFDRATWSVATSAGNGKEFFFAQGAFGGFDWYGARTTEISHKSPMFFGKDIDNMYLSLPVRRSNEEWIVGYNGAQSSKSIKYTSGPDAEPVKIKFLFTGGPTYRFFGGPKEYVVSYSVPLDCTEDCSGGCTGDELDPLKYVQAHIDAINNHTELNKFGVLATLVSDTYEATTTNMTKYQLSVCDNGDGVALNAVRAQAPTDATVTRVARNGSTSIYEVCISDDDSAPTAFAQSASVLQAICGECPAGSTLTAPTTTYFVTRPITPSTDLSDGTAQQTFATSIATAYKVPDTATIATTDVSGNVITETAHNFTTGQPITYSNGGGASITGLTTATVYYAIVLSANTFSVATTYANAVAGTVVPLSGTGNNAQTFTPVMTATFVSQNGGVAVVKLNTTGEATPTALLSDGITLAYETGATCVFATPTPIAWVETGTGIRSRRTLQINQLKREECTGANRLTDLAAILSGVKGVDVDTLAVVAGDDCFDDYTVEQDSIDCLSEEECLTNNVTFNYVDLPSIDGQTWFVVPEVVSPNTDRKVGIRITANYNDPKFGDCSFDPIDYYETEPLKMEVSIFREWNSVCDVSLFPSVVRTKYGAIERQSGEYVIREVIMKTDAYQKHIQQFSTSPRMREAFDMNLLGMVDRKAFYNIYYVTYRASYGKLWRKNEQEKFTTLFCFKEDDSRQDTFKTQVLDVLTAKSGVVLHVNE